MTTITRPRPRPVSTLQVLERIADGQTLVHLNREVPSFLLLCLSTRGFRYRIERPESGGVELHIRRHWHPGGRWPWTPRVARVRPATLPGGAGRRE